MEKKKKKEYWLFTILTNYSTYVNCYFDDFPTKDELKKACNSYNGYSYAIISMTKLTEEQYSKLTGNISL